MSAAAAWRDPNQAMSNVVRVEIENAKAYLFQIDHLPLGSIPYVLVDAVRRLVDCIDGIADHVDPACAGLILDCVHDANVELDQVRYRLGAIANRLAEKKLVPKAVL